MTRTLFLMRHAEAVACHPRGDRARELSGRGRAQARQAGLELANRGIELVLCSDSQRTRQTCTELGLRLPDGSPVPVEYMPALYLAGADTIRQRISEIPDEVGALLVIAHAPGIPTLAAELAWRHQPRAADQLQCWFPVSSHGEFLIRDGWSTLLDAGPFQSGPHLGEPAGPAVPAGRQPEPGGPTEDDQEPNRQPVIELVDVHRPGPPARD